MFESFQPKLSQASKDADVLFLANIQPDLQREVLGSTRDRMLREMELINQKRALQQLEHQFWRAPSAHNTQPWQLAYGADRIELEFDRTCQNKFRSESDLVPEWLHNFAAITSGRGFVGGKLTYNYIVINSKKSLPRILGLFFRRVPSVLCLNDVSELASTEIASEAIIEVRLRLITKLLESDR